MFVRTHPNLVFLWHKGRNFRYCKLAAPLYFIRGTSARKLLSTRFRFRNVFRTERTIRKLMGRRAKYTKKYSRNAKLNEKNSCTPINPKKYSCYDLKKIHARNSKTKKKFLPLENSPPPSHNFPNGPSLSDEHADP